MFMNLVPTTQSARAALRLLRRAQVWKIRRCTGRHADLPINKVGVIGAGTMGGGISMNFLNVGIPVTIVETAAGRRSTAASHIIRRNYENTAKKGRLTQADVDNAHGSAQPRTLDLQTLADCDLIIEAVFENMDIKKDVFRKLDKIAKQGAILASNTSYLNVDEIASVDQAAGIMSSALHFFSPANVMRLLEIVRGAKTSKPRDRDRACSSRARSARSPRSSASATVLSATACWRSASARRRSCILEGAMPWDVDRVLYDFGMPMGPFAMSDLAGLDIGWSKETSQVLDDPRNPLRDGSPRAEDRRRLLRLRREPQRQAFAGRRKDHSRFCRQEGHQPAQHLRRGNSRALHLSDDQ